MWIDCNNIEIDFTIPNTSFSLNKLKSAKLVKEIKEVNDSFIPRRNFMVMSMNIFNLLEHHDKFEHRNLLGINNTEQNTLYPVGRIYEIDCYVDIHMMEDTILLSWDKQISRELKLESLLNDNNQDLEQLKIDVSL